MKPVAVAASVVGLLMLCLLASYVGLMSQWPWESDNANLPWNRISHKEVCRRWGEHPLDTEEFKVAEAERWDEAARAAAWAARAGMACSLLENQNEYIGKSTFEIRNIFGHPDGYYQTDVYPAYRIGGAGEEERDAWQILFLLDNHRRISAIVVHRSW